MIIWNSWIQKEKLYMKKDVYKFNRLILATTWASIPTCSCFAATFTYLRIKTIKKRVWETLSYISVFKSRRYRALTCDLLLSKHCTTYVHYQVLELWLFFCSLLRGLSWQIKQYLAAILSLFKFLEINKFKIIKYQIALFYFQKFLQIMKDLFF